jgi:outer membrane protein assembly factor BamB
MSEDFVTQLRLQLREAAEREARRGPARRLARQASAQQPWRPALALAALALGALALLSAAKSPHHREPTPAHRGLHVLQRQQLVNAGGFIDTAFGSVWAEDRAAGELLRIDPRTRAVRARVKVSGGGVGFAFTDGAVWALDSARWLLKIDPRTNRVVARFPTQTRGIFAGRDALWLQTLLGMQRFDPATDAFDRPITLTEAGFHASAVATDGRELYISRADGTLLVFDAHTGARRPSPGVEVDGSAVAAAHGVVILASQKGVSALNAHTARMLWTTELSKTPPVNVALSRGVVWVEGVDETGSERLWRLDAASGRVTGSVRLQDFGAPGLAVVGERVWVVSTNGVLQIVG